jgi:hypothetical protein
MSKINSDHLDRAAYVYVRQSSMAQVHAITKASDANTACGSARGCLDGRM